VQILGCNVISDEFLGALFVPEDTQWVCTRQTKAQCARCDTWGCIHGTERFVIGIASEENSLVVLSILLFAPPDFDEVDSVNISVLVENERAFFYIKEYPIREDLC